MKRIAFLFMVGLFAIGKALATDKVTDYSYVVIWNSDSTNNVFKCADRPVISMTAENMVLRVNGTEILYSVTEYRKFTFGKKEDYESGIKKPDTNALYEVTQHAVRISGLKESATAGIFSTDGKCMIQGKAKNGEITFDTTKLKTGVYVVKCGTINFKFLKK